MNFKRIMAGALAGSMVAALSAAPVFADTEYHAYLCFQTGSYSFRNAWDDASYGLNGTSNTEDIDYSVVHAWDGNTLISADGTFTDATITKDGTYTVSVSGLNWTSDEFSGSSNKYRMIYLSTDVPSDLEGVEITIDNVTVGDKSYDAPAVWDDGYVDQDYHSIKVDSEYNEGKEDGNGDIFESSLLAYDALSTDISITFTVSGISETTGDVAPVAYLGAIVAVAGVAMVASRKVRA